MKRAAQFVFFLAVLAVGAPAWAACSSTNFANGWTCIQQGITKACASTCTSNQGTSGALTITAGHGVVISALACAGTATCNNSLLSLTITSNQSDSFVASPSGPTKVLAGTNNETLAMWGVGSAVGGSTTFTVHCGATCSFMNIWVSDWTGAANPFAWDQDHFGATTTNGTSTTCSGSATTNANDLWYSFIDSNGGTAETWTPGTGYTSVGSNSTDAHEAKSVTSAGTLSAGWSWSATNTVSFGCGGIHANSGVAAAGGFDKRKKLEQFGAME